MILNDSRRGTIGFMSKFITYLIFMCLAYPTYAQFSGGDGSKGNPYKVSTPDDLAHLATHKGAGLFFVQTNDISLDAYLDTCKATGDSGWYPIGKNGYPFKGNYDGGGFTISGLWINRLDMEFVGFFGFINNDTVENLTIETSVEKGVNGGTIVGALCGNSSGVIKNCKISGVITGREQVGAIVGANWGILDHSSASATVTATVKSGGGLCGTFVNSGSILFCYAHCTVIGGQQVGGLVGATLGGASGMVMNCFAKGTVTGTGSVGGIIGANSMKIYNSYSLAVVSGDGACGGIAGNNGGTINECYFVKDAGLNELWSGIGFDSCNQASHAHAATKNEFSNRNSFPSWDFDYVWSIDPAKNSGNPFPSLKPVGEIYRGSGTQTQPFMIENPQQLQALTYFGADSTLFFTLKSDIDLSSYLSQSGVGYNNALGWLSINLFCGKLDGAGYSIKGLWSDRPYEIYAGLMLFCNGIVTDLNIEVMDGKCITGLNEVGILCSKASSKTVITSCKTSGSVKVTDLIGGDNAINKFVGGMVGKLSAGKIINCHSSANCYFEQKDSVVDNRDGAGGLVGYNEQGNILNCYATGNITCLSTSAGGLVGQNYGNITKSFASGAVSVTGRGIDAGGFVGTHGKSVYDKTRTGTISQCFATGNVTATGTYAAAGSFAGTIASYGDSALIRDAYATGNITVEGKSVRAGGFVGANGGKVENCYAAGVFKSPASGYEIGEFAGVNYTKKTFRNCYYLKGNIVDSTGKIIGHDYDTITPQSINIRGLVGTEMKLKASFTGWNFNTVWKIEENVSYPVFQDQPIMSVFPIKTIAGRSTYQISTLGRNTIFYRIPEGMEDLCLCIYSINGRRILKYENLKSSGSITVSSLPPGLYVTSLESRGRKMCSMRNILFR